MLHLKTDVTVHVSTIDLSISGWGRGFETCLFFENGHSEVVEWYATEEDAIEGHHDWCLPSAIKAQIEGFVR